MDIDIHPELLTKTSRSDFPVKAIRRLSGSMVALAVVIGLGGCSGMSRQDQNTLTGAGIGGVAGAVLTKGSPVGTVGGAVVGGVIGHEVSTDNDSDRNRDKNWERERSREMERERQQNRDGSQ